MKLNLKIRTPYENFQLKILIITWPTLLHAQENPDQKIKKKRKTKMKQTDDAKTRGEGDVLPY